MKLICLGQDQEIGRKICEAADRLHWSAMYLTERGALAQAMREYDPDLLLVEINRYSDLQWWKTVNLTADKPVIFMNEEITEEFMSEALDLGADAFLPKALFTPRHFEARIRALLRRRGLGANRRYVSRLNLLVDSERYCIEISGKPLDLTLTEFKILRELALEEAKVVSRLEIQTRVFGQAKLSNRSLDVHVCAVRKKVKPFGLDIDSVRGVGYRLQPVASLAAATP